MNIGLNKRNYLYTFVFVVFLMGMLFLSGNPDFILNNFVSHGNRSSASLDRMEDKKGEKWANSIFALDYFVDPDGVELAEVSHKRWRFTYNKNRQLFEAFTALICFFLCRRLKKSRRRIFEVTHFKHLRRLMRYLHKVDGKRRGGLFFIR